MSPSEKREVWIRWLFLTVGLAGIVFGISTQITHGWNITLWTNTPLFVFGLYPLTRHWKDTPERRGLLSLRLKERWRLSVSEDNFDSTLGRWSLFYGGLLWTCAGAVLTLMRGWGPHAMLGILGPPVFAFGLRITIKAWRRGLL